ncbi:MAG TPA: hypothetical protein VIW26_16625 [Gemmatimonadales bacterium]
MTRTRDNYQVHGNSVTELIASLNFLLQRLADRMDRIEGIRGTASIESNLDMNANVITEVGGGSFDDDAARLSDIQTINAFTITAGAGLTGGGQISTNPTLDVGAGTAISVGADAVSVATDGVDNTLLANMAQATIKGRAAAAGTGDPTDLSAAQVKTILALTSADVSDFTEAAQDAVGGALTDSASIDFTYNDGAGTITAIVIDDSISDAKLRNSGALSVIGRSANSTGDPADISSSSNDTVLRRTSTTLNWGQLTAGMFPATVIPDNALSSNIPLKNGANVWTASGGAAQYTSADPLITLTETDAAANNQVWFIRIESEAFKLGVANDAVNSFVAFLQTERTANTIDSVTLTATDVVVTGKFKTTGNVGFNNTTPIAKPTVSGSRAGNAALASLLTALANYGLVTDSSSA